MAVAHDAVDAQIASVADPQTCAHQDPGQQSTPRIRKSGQNVFAFQLGHHRFRQRSGRTAHLSRVVLVEHIYAWLQPWFPPVLAGAAQQAGQAADLGGAALQKMDRSVKSTTVSLYFCHDQDAVSAG
ncbi:hypothetical protein [Mycobacterium sp.]|uniref:hypothetical protein n=1 Tax=Mycobacterium sp. TaxID=1785 RepID=UPI0031D4E504